MHVQEFSEKGAFFRVRLRSEQVREKGIFFGHFGQKGYLFHDPFHSMELFWYFSCETFSLQLSFKIIHVAIQ